MAGDDTSQMQYYDTGGNGKLADTGCDNCHSASQYRPYNYTTRNIAGGAEVTLGSLGKLVYGLSGLPMDPSRTNASSAFRRCPGDGRRTGVTGERTADPCRNHGRLPSPRRI
jgi:hypothetical protein